MNKEEIEEYIVEQKIKESEKAGRIKERYIWGGICATAATAVMTTFYRAGHYAYETWGALQAGYSAFLAALQP